MRTPSSQIAHEAVEDLARALRAIGFEASVEEAIGDRRADIVIGSGRGRRVIEVKARAVASELPGPWLDVDSESDLLVLVADVVTETARRQLREASAGWLDRRGHLHLPPDRDFDVEPCPRPSSPEGVSDPLAGRAALEVAVAALVEPDAPPGVRELARQVDMAPSSISAARSTLIDALLLTTAGTPVRPNLFTAVSGRWTPDWIPADGDPSGGLDNVDLAIGGDVGAVLNGAPMVVGSATVPRYYVATRSDRRNVMRILGEGSRLEPHAWIGVAPARYIMEAATERESMDVPGIQDRVVPPVVSALELATDQARGREILGDWNIEGAQWRP